ncbi:hypothetical protein P3T39_000773 [Kitasatospora sp. GP82]|nr:hypothetical protein [Kitasatospora sp. GP82]MDH6576063.1 hypothetical protein [Kitasatospora sp. MAP5-34]
MFGALLALVSMGSFFLGVALANVGEWLREQQGRHRG